MTMNIIDLLQELVSINTINDPLRGVKPDVGAAKFIKDWLEDWKIEASLIESNGFYSVFGKIGKGAPRIMLLAHYDTVPVDPEEWNFDPFKLTIKDEKAYGRGALDDKSNVVALMLTLRELSKSNLKNVVYFAFTGDEEIGGTHGAKVIADLLENKKSLPPYLLNADGHGMRVITRRRKAFNIVIEVPAIKRIVKGRIERKVFKSYFPALQHTHSALFVAGADVHPLIATSSFVRDTEVMVSKLEGKFLKSNVIPSEVTLEYVTPEGENEIEVDEGLTKLLATIVSLTKLAFPTERFSEYGVTITPNMYVYRNKTHILTLDVRAMLKSGGILRKAVNKALKELLPVAKSSVTESRGSYLYTSLSSPIVKAFKNSLEKLGEPFITCESAGASDSRHFTIYGVEAVDFGPKGGNMHGPNEYVELSSLRKLPKIYLHVVQEILKSSK